ncbi:MAG TPA: NAD(P)H-binding protein [Marmoricola sp.]|nr:NAD(P)H-binding protein [Marmoricola sp.]
MIVVVGGTGRLGSLVANLLSVRGHEVRVVSRRLVASKVPLDDEIEQVRGDVRDPARMRALVTGAEVVVLAMQGFAGQGGVSPRTVDRDGSRHVVEAAEQQGADVVLVSVAGASDTSALELARAKYHAEQQLRASRCAWTIVRPDAFAQTWVELLEQTAGRSHRPLVFGAGDNPIGWVDVHEVAALVERAVLDTSLRGRTLQITGPERLTLEELAGLVMAHHGWPGRPRRVPRAVLRAVAATGPLRPAVSRRARAALAMDVLAPVDDHETRAAFPDLPRTRVSELFGQRA